METHAPVPGRHSRGQALPFFALVLPALLAFMALGLDGANMFTERREAQGVADLAALAGVRDLPANAVAARNSACAVARANGYTTSSTHPCPGVTVTTPYGGQSTRIEVVINTSVRTFFMPILGVSTVQESARAVALSQPTASGTYAIFALAADCNASESEKVIEWSGSSNVVNGSIHSSSGMLVPGSDNSVPAPHAITYACPGEFTESGNNNGILPEANPEPCPGRCRSLAHALAVPARPSTLGCAVTTRGLLRLPVGPGLASGTTR